MVYFTTIDAYVPT